MPLSILRVNRMSAQGVPSTILLAEDDPNDVWLVSRALAPFQSRYRLEVVADGEQAIQFLSGTGRYSDRAGNPLPALVLLDVRLPRVDGLEVLSWIRQHPRLCGLVVVMLTGSESPEDLQKAYDLHVNSFLKKSPLLAMPEVSKNVLSYWLEVNQVPRPKAD